MYGEAPMPSERDHFLNSPTPFPSGRAPQGESHSTIRVLIVDDHEMMRQSLRRLLNTYRNMEVVGEAGDGVEAIKAVPILRPDVVLMDIDMPRMNGIEATKRIKAAFPSTAVIGLSVQLAGDIIQQMRTGWTWRRRHALLAAPPATLRHWSNSL